MYTKLLGHFFKTSLNPVLGSWVHVLGQLDPSCVCTCCLCLRVFQINFVTWADSVRARLPLNLQSFQNSGGPQWSVWLPLLWVIHHHQNLNLCYIGMTSSCQSHWSWQAHEWSRPLISWNDLCLLSGVGLLQIVIGSPDCSLTPKGGSF